MEEKRRSLESQKDCQRETQKESARNESFEKREDGTSPRSGEKPPQVPLTYIYVSASFLSNFHIFSQAEAKGRKKKSSREEKAEGGGPSLMRKPSMKKLKAFFDKDKNKENKGEKEERVSDADYASAVSKLPSLETGQEPLLPGSKSVPSSLDRKQRYRDSDYRELGSLDARGAQNRNWPLGGKQGSNEGLAERPALPVKRSKSMKSITPGLPGVEPSFGREEFRDSVEPSSPYDTYPKAKPRSEELIDLTKRQPMDPQDPYEGRTRFDFDPAHIRQGSGGDGGSRAGVVDDSRATYHFGEGAPKSQAMAAPPKPKRDWSR